MIVFVGGVIAEHDVILADDGCAISSSSVGHERHLILLVTKLLLGTAVLGVFF